VASIAAVEWRVKKDMKDDVFEFYTTDMGPNFALSEDVLRQRLFEIDGATTLKGSSSETEEQDSFHTYLTLIEFESEELPWEGIVSMGGTAKWRQYFEDPNVSVSGNCVCGWVLVLISRQKWQLSMYVVKKTYLDEAKETKNT
jgi:hypothetical protein